MIETMHPDPHASSTRRTLKTLIGAATKQWGMANADAATSPDIEDQDRELQWRLYREALQAAASAYERIGQ